MTSNTYWTPRHSNGLVRAGFSRLETEAVQSIAPMFHPQAYDLYILKPEGTPPEFLETPPLQCPTWLMFETLRNSGVEFKGPADAKHPDIYWVIDRIVQELQKKVPNAQDLARKLDAHVFLEQGPRVVYHDEVNPTYTLFFERIEANVSRTPTQVPRF
jgi:hypothetical protein